MIDHLVLRQVQHQRIVVVRRLALVSAGDVEQESLGIVAVGDPGDIPARVEVVEVDLEVLEPVEGEVRPNVHILGRVRVDDALGYAVARRGEIGDIVAPAPDGHGIVLDVGVAKPTAAGRAAGIRDQLALLVPIEVVAVFEGVGELAGAVVHAQAGGIECGPHVADALDSLTHVHGPARRAGCTPLGEDLDHSGAGVGAVEARRRWPLDDFDPVDVLLAYAAEEGRVLLGFAGGILKGAGRHAHAIDVDEGAVAPVHGVGSPEQDVRSRAGRSGCSRYAHAQSAAAECVLEVDGAGVEEFVGGDEGYAVADFALLGRDRRSRYDHPLHLDRLGIHGDVDDLRPFGTYRDRAAFLPEADELRDDFVFSGGHAEDQKPALVVRNGPQPGTLQRHLDVGERFSRLTAYECAGDRPRLCRKGAGEKGEGQRHRPPSANCGLPPALRNCLRSLGERMS